MGQVPLACHLERPCYAVVDAAASIGEQCVGKALQIMLWQTGLPAKLLSMTHQAAAMRASPHADMYRKKRRSVSARRTRGRRRRTLRGERQSDWRGVLS